MGTSVETKQLYLDIANTIWLRLPKNHPLRNKMLEAKIAATFDLSLYQQIIPDCKLLILQADTLEQKLYAYARLANSYVLLREPNKGLDYAEEGYSLIRGTNTELSYREGYLRSYLLDWFAEAHNMLGAINEQNCRIAQNQAMEVSKFSSGS